MDLEICMINAKDGDSAGFIKAMADGGTEALLSCPGCNTVSVLPGVENPGKVLLMIEWDSVAAHNAAKEAPGFGKFLAAAGPFFGEGASMEHFSLA